MTERRCFFCGVTDRDGHGPWVHAAFLDDCTDHTAWVCGAGISPFPALTSCRGHLLDCWLDWQRNHTTVFETATA